MTNHDTDLEHQMQNLLRNNGRPQPPPVDDHRPQDDIGRLSAEAVMKQWEQTAMDVENLGIEVKERAAKLQAALRDCDQDLKLLGQAAQQIRAKGVETRVMLEKDNEASKNIRDMIASFNGSVS